LEELLDPGCSSATTTAMTTVAPVAASTAAVVARRSWARTSPRDPGGGFSVGYAMDRAFSASYRSHQSTHDSRAPHTHLCICCGSGQPGSGGRAEAEVGRPEEAGRLPSSGGEEADHSGHPARPGRLGWCAPK
jgi:hypothetical protein